MSSDAMACPTLHTSAPCSSPEVHPSQRLNRAITSAAKTNPTHGQPPFLQRTFLLGTRENAGRTPLGAYALRHAVHIPERRQTATLSLPESRDAVSASWLRIFESGAHRTHP
jgi:hypothetical protein